MAALLKANTLVTGLKEEKNTQQLVPINSRYTRDRRYRFSLSFSGWEHRIWEHNMRCSHYKLITALMAVIIRWQLFGAMFRFRNDDDHIVIWAFVSFWKDRISNTTTTKTNCRHIKWLFFSPRSISVLAIIYIFVPVWLFLHLDLQLFWNQSSQEHIVFFSPQEYNHIKSILAHILRSKYNVQFQIIKFSKFKTYTGNKKKRYIVQLTPKNDLFSHRVTTE